MKKFLIGIMIAILPTSIFAIGGFGLSVNSSTFSVDAGSSDLMVEGIKVGSFSYDSFENGGGIGGYLYLDIIPVVDLDIELSVKFAPYSFSFNQNSGASSQDSLAFVWASSSFYITLQKDLLKT